MKVNYCKSKGFLINVILFFLTFILGLILGWIIFGAITKELIIKSLSIAMCLEFILHFSLKKAKPAD